MTFSAEQIDYLHHYLNQHQPSLAGKFLYYCIPFRKKIVLQNMRQVFATIFSESQIKHLAKLFYTHIAISLKENSLMRFFPLETLCKKVSVKGEEYLWELVGHPVKGAILITGHFGNWEFAPVAGILHAPAWRDRFFVVRKLIGNKWIEKILFRRFYQAGLNVIPKHNALSQVIVALEKNNAVVFIMDQHASLSAKDGIAVDFFGKQAGTFRSPAMIARHTHVPILGFRSYRKKDGHHVLEFFPRFEWIKHADQKQELLLNTREYNKFLERIILEYPDQWLWMHKRWKNQ